MISGSKVSRGTCNEHLSLQTGGADPEVGGDVSFWERECFPAIPAILTRGPISARDFVIQPAGTGTTALISAKSRDQEDKSPLMGPRGEALLFFQVKVARRATNATLAGNSRALQQQPASPFPSNCMCTKTFIRLLATALTLILF